jgi:hypothetical protein
MEDLLQSDQVRPARHDQVRLPPSADRKLIGSGLPEKLQDRVVQGGWRGGAQDGRQVRTKILVEGHDPDLAGYLGWRCVEDIRLGRPSDRHEHGQQAGSEVVSDHVASLAGGRCMIIEMVGNLITDQVEPGRWQ